MHIKYQTPTGSQRVEHDYVHTHTHTQSNQGTQGIAGTQPLGWVLCSPFNKFHGWSSNSW